jgi:glycosyltransferase involved in cell wall biosynthesis
MAMSAEPHLTSTNAHAFDRRWRAELARVQEVALPAGAVVVTCNAPLGEGGLGRHLEEIVEALDRSGQPHVALCSAVSANGEPSILRTLRVPGLAVAQMLPPLRFSRAWRTWVGSAAFDSYAVRQLPAAEHLIAFNGQALVQMRAFRRRGGRSVSLVSANSHLKRVARLHARAYDQYPLERSWASRLVRRNCAEYSRADRIFVSSRYVWQSFVEEGVSEDRLVLFPLSPDPRYAPGPAARESSSFDVVYVGSLTVAKGVPLLIEAFRRVGRPDMRLVLVGGWATRAMRRFVERACAEDSRITVRPGDPLPHLRAARVCVHPTYEDGFAYAPAEALGCGVPVIVSEDTGMKELVDPGYNGHVFPTGDVSALAEAIAAAYGGHLFARIGERAESTTNPPAWSGGAI